MDEVVSYWETVTELKPFRRQRAGQVHTKALPQSRCLSHQFEQQGAPLGLAVTTPMGACVTAVVADRPTRKLNYSRSSPVMALEATVSIPAPARVDGM
jgi:hypothetical protein